MSIRRRGFVLLLLTSLVASTFSAAPASAVLYSFTSHTFTPCSATGISGPTLSTCQTAYSSTTWKNDSTLFNVSSGIQLWTVPVTGTYRITVAGAAGGAGKQTGGKGVTISGEFNLIEGAVLKILVGQIGATFSTGSGGGGGGTFVASNSNVPFIIAGGGGGGGGSSSATHAGRDATFTTTAANATSGGGGGTATAGGSGTTVQYGGGGGGSAANGVSGGVPTNNEGGLAASGGAGFGGDGGRGQNSPVIPKSFLTGGTGGYRPSSWGSISTTFGGFGGGGNGTGISYVSGGGGGGGYAGGGGGDGLNIGGGGGGGSSYNSGANAQNINATNTGDGSAIFLLIASDSTPPSITSGTTFDVNENSTAITTLTANETSTWSISAGVDSLTVSVDSSTGVLRFNVAQNFESPGDSDSNRTYLFTVRATDLAGNSSTSSITVTLTDINEAPVINSNGGGISASLSISENTLAVTTISAVDVDSGSVLTYSISGTDASDFTVGTSNGALTFASSPNFESPIDSDLNNVYLLVVAVSDGSLIDTQTLTITITDVTDSASISSPSFSSSPNKGASTTLTFQIDVAGKATFYASGRKIPGCISKSTSGSSPITAICIWKPATSGLIPISVSIRPSGSGVSTTTSATTTVQVGRRAGLR